MLRKCGSAHARVEVFAAGDTRGGNDLTCRSQNDRQPTHRVAILHYTPVNWKRSFRSYPMKSRRWIC